MKLYDMYDRTEMWDGGGALALAYLLLSEREPHENISHKAMPSWQYHLWFVTMRPYPHWYWFRSASGAPAGCVYLTNQREIGIGVLKEFRGQGLAGAAIAEMQIRHPGRFLANINPANASSIALFRKLGFGGPIQITLEKP